MKRTSSLIPYVVSITVFGVFLPRAFADGTFHPAVRPTEPMAEQVSWQEKGKRNGCESGSPSKGGVAHSAHGFNLPGRRGAANLGYGPDCPCAQQGLLCAIYSRAASAVRFGAGGGMWGVMQSGQPLIDPWARGDWIASQQAATRSWHAGYYHTQWGVPLALMAPPHARMQTRWGWGVSQSTMTPLYHQYKRPYPGGVATDERGTGFGPLLPTPRWPSHTDQFGVYYVRGPW